MLYYKNSVACTDIKQNDIDSTWVEDKFLSTHVIYFICVCLVLPFFIIISISISFILDKDEVLNSL